jgi:hypothetical protein
LRERYKDISGKKETVTSQVTVSLLFEENAPSANENLTGVAVAPRDISAGGVLFGSGADEPRQVWGLLNGLLYDAPVIQELDGCFIPAVFPHQREEPNSAFADPEIGGGKGHL